MKLRRKVSQRAPLVIQLGPLTISIGRAAQKSSKSDKGDSWTVTASIRRPAIEEITSHLRPLKSIFRFVSFRPRSLFRAAKPKLRPPVVDREFAKAVLKHLSEFTIDSDASGPKYVVVDRLRFGDNPIQSEVGVRFRLVNHRQSLDESLFNADPQLPARRPRSILGEYNSVLEEKLYDFTFYDPANLEYEGGLFKDFVERRLKAQ